MKPLRLRTKILLSIGLIIFGVLGTSTFVHIQDLKRDYLEALTWRSQALAQDIINEITDMQDLGLTQIEDMFPPLALRCIKLYHLNQDKNIGHFAVIDASGVIGPHNDDDLWNTPVSSPTLLAHLRQHRQMTLLEGEMYHTLVPVFDEQGSEYVATIDVGTPKRVVDEKVRKVLVQSLILFAVFMLLAFVMMSFLMHMLLTKPVQHLVRLGQHLAAGNLVHIPQPTEPGDEVAVLTSAFRQISVYLRNLADVASHIATGVLDGDVRVRSEQDILGTAVDDMLRYLNQVAKIATEIAEGDLTAQLSLRSTQDAFGQALQRMMTYLRDMADVAATISQGDLRAEIMPRSERDVLGSAFQRMTAYLNWLANAATAIANGDLQQDIQPESEHDVLGNAFHTMAVQLRENFAQIQQEVAERRRAQEALERLNEELEQRVEARTAELTREKYILETFMSTVPDRIYFKDCQGRITNANKAHAERYGFRDPAEEFGKTDFDLLPEDIARVTFEQEQQIIRSGEPLLDAELPIPCADGATRWALVTKMPLRDENGDIIGTFGISKDITSLKQAQASLEHAYSEILSLNHHLQEDSLRYYMRALLLGAPSGHPVAAGITTTFQQTWNAPYFCVVLLKVLPQNGKLSASTVSASHLPVSQSMAELMRLYDDYRCDSSLDGIFSQLTETEAALILNPAEKAQVQEVCSFLHTHSALEFQHQAITLIIGMGTVVSRPEDLHTSYDTAQQALLARRNTLLPQVLSIADVEERKRDALMFYMPEEKERQLMKAVIAGQAAQTRELLQEIVDQNNLEQSSYHKLLGLYQYFLRTASKILAQAPIQDLDAGELPLLQSFRAARPETLQELREQLEDIFQQLLTFYNQGRKVSPDPLITTLLRYLKQHCTDHNLSLESLADAFSLNPSYLSRYFKEQTGMNYVEYLAVLRINKAKNLLVSQPKQRIYEIGAQVGFSGRETFIRCFKRLEGLTPGAYRKRALSHL